MSILSLLRSLPLFEGLNDEELKKIESLTIKHKLPPGVILFREGDPGTSFYMIQSGSVKIYQEKNGREKLITVFKYGEGFGELSMIDGEPRSATAQTIESSVLLSLARKSIMELMETNFTVTKKILEVLSRRLRKTNQQVADLVFLDAKTQVIKTLISLANEHGVRQEHHIKIEVNLTYGEMASISGVSEETFMYVLKMLEQKGMVKVGNQAIWLNVYRLSP